MTSFRNLEICVNESFLKQNATKEPELDALCKKSVVKEIDGRKVGIIGYVLPETTTLSNPGENVTFLNEITR